MLTSLTYQGSIQNYSPRTCIEKISPHTIYLQIKIKYIAKENTVFWILGGHFLAKEKFRNNEKKSPYILLINLLSIFFLMDSLQKKKRQREREDSNTYIT